MFPQCSCRCLFLRQNLTTDLFSFSPIKFCFLHIHICIRTAKVVANIKYGIAYYKVTVYNILNLPTNLGQTLDRLSPKFRK